MNMIDITEYPGLVETINAIINNNGIAEIKVENKTSAPKITVVEQNRNLKLVKYVEDSK